MNNNHIPYNLNNAKPPLLCKRQMQILWLRAKAQCAGADWWLSHYHDWCDALLQLAEDEC